MDQSLQTFNLFGSGDDATQIALALVVLLALVAIGAIYVPIGLHVARLLRLDAALAVICSEHKSAALRRHLGAAFQSSPVRAQFDEFRDRWTTVQDVSGGELSSVRLSDVLQREPLLPAGPRRALMPHLPRMLLGATALGALVPYASHLSRHGQAAIELGIPVLFWGLCCVLLAFVASRWLEGTLEATASKLDRWAERAYPAAGQAELAAAFHRDQLQTIERLQTHITTFGRRAGNGSGAAVANVDVEQIAHDLSQSLSSVVQQHSKSLLQVHRQEMGDQRSAIDSLEEVAKSARRAADSLASSAQFLEPLLDELKGAGLCLERTAREAVTQASTHSEQMDARLGHLQTGLELIGKRVELALTVPAARTTAATDGGGAEGRPAVDAKGAGRAVEAEVAKTGASDETAGCEEVLRELEAEESTAGAAATSKAQGTEAGAAAHPEASRPAPATAGTKPASPSRTAEGKAPAAEDTDADIDRAVAQFLTPVDEGSAAPSDDAPPASGGGGLSSLLTRR